MRRIKITEDVIAEVMNSVKKQLTESKSAQHNIKMEYSLTMGKAKDEDKAHIIFTEQAWNKMQGLIETCAVEIAWHGTVKKIDKNHFEIIDILVFPQTVSAATVTTDDVAYPKWLMEQPDEVYNTIRFHGHSHVNFGVSPSGVDTTYQDNILQNLNDFYIFGILNKKDENWFTIFDVTNNIVYEDEDIIIHSYLDKVYDWVDTEMEKYVTKFIAPAKTYTGTSDVSYYQQTFNKNGKPESWWERKEREAQEATNKTTKKKAGRPPKKSKAAQEAEEKRRKEVNDALNKMYEEQYGYYDGYYGAQNK